MNKRRFEPTVRLQGEPPLVVNLYREFTIYGYLDSFVYWRH